MLMGQGKLKRLLAAFVVGTIAFWGAGDAFAQRKGKKDPAQEAKEQKEKQAYDLYQEGITNYNLGEFDKAIEKFKAAYALTGAPGLLFNVAQAYRLKKDYDQALYFYKTYLRLDPDAPNKADVDARVAEMERMIQEQKNLDKAKPVGTIPPGGTGVPDQPGGGGGGGGGNVTTPPGGGNVTTPPGGGGGNVTTPPGGGGTQISSNGSSGGDGGSSVSGGGDEPTGVAGVYRPHGGTLGFVARADVDTATFKGAAFAVGLSYAFAPSFEADAGALITGKIGATVGATLLFSTSKLRPLASLSVPMFFENGTHLGVHGAVGLRYDLGRSFGIQVDLGVAHFLSVPTPDFKTTYFIPSIGIQGRL
jgi:hypothetical protein